MRQRFILAGGASVLAIAAVATSIQRIPEGSIGLRPGAVVDAGLGFAPPWGRATVVRAGGKAALAGLTFRTPEGSELVFDVDVDYTLATTIPDKFRDDAARRGLDAALGTLAGHVLQDLGERSGAEALLSDPSTLEAALRAAFGSNGVTATRVSARSTMGDEVLGRRRTAEARERVRPMSARRLVVVGWDGADWEILDPMLAAGRMPHLAGMLASGVRADLRSYDPMFSPLLWTTMATGKPPTQHGIADFLVKDPGTGKRRPITSDFRKVKALWNICGDLGRESGWVAWWATFPAEPIRGTMVSELLASVSMRGADAALAVKGIASPESWLSERRDLIVAAADVTYEEMARLFPVARAEFEDARRRAPEEQVDPDSKAAPDPLTFTVKLLSATRTYHNVGVDMLKSGLPVVSIYYEAPDMMGHRFQHYMPPKMAMVSDEEFARFRDAVGNYYEVQDRMLGEVLAAAGPDADVVLVSDHGFRNGDDRPTDVAPFTTGQPAEWHRPWGIFAARGPSFRTGRIGPASLYDIAPTLLYLQGFPQADDMPGRVIEAALRPGLLASRSPSRIRSYELVGDRIARRAPAEIDPAAMEEMMANLRALGYVGGETTDPVTAPAATGAATAPETAAGGDASQTQVYYHRNLATYHRKQGNLAAAEQELLLANERQPFPKTYAMLGEVRASQGRFAEAAEAIEEGYRTIPSMMEPESLLWLVEMYLRAGNPGAAGTVVSRLGSRATAAVREAIQGRLADAAGNVDAATAAYERALAQDPLLVSVAMRLGDLYRARGAPGRIVPFLEQGVAKNPKADAYHHLLGELALAGGDAKGAHAHFLRAVDIQPENGLYLGHLANAAAALGRTAEARQSLEWAERWTGREAPSWIAIGGAWDRLGEPDRALAAFAKAREFGAQGPAPEIGTILALARAGRVAQARRALAEATQRFPESRALADLAARLR
ncbi:MAG TPA: alkaline phosphatase family protein [Candidatus Polarisedimenticolaceae bacterium]